VEGFEGFWRKEAGTGAGAEDGVEDDGDFRLTADSEKSSYSRDDFRGIQHSDLNSRWREVGAKVLEGVLKQGWRNGVDLGDAEGGLDGQRGDGRGAQEAVGSKGLQIRSDSRSAAGIVASDGEEGAGGWVGNRRKTGQEGNPMKSKPYHIQERFATIYRK
jgi:hypothetical protein